MVCIWKTLAVAAIFSVCSGFSKGPPLEACVDMFPVGHKVDSSPVSLTPYTLTINASTYRPGDVIEVILNSTGVGGITFFEGAMIQARRANCTHLKWAEAVGTFTVETNETFLGYMNCQGGERNTIGHKDHAHIYSRRFFWNAPIQAVGHVYLKAVVARRESTFWSTISSEYILDPTDSTSPPSEKCKPRIKYETCPPQKDPSSATRPGSLYIIKLVSVLAVMFLF